MLLCRFELDGAERVGCLDGEDVHLVEGDPMVGLVPGPRVGGLADVTLLPPCLPTKVLGVGLNYRAHAAEMGKPLPEEPLLFLKPPSAVIGTGVAIARPRGYARVDYEGELALVIGRTTRRVPPAEAMRHVLGVTCLNDVTVRDLQKKDVQYTRAKGFDTFAPIGPAIRVTGGLDPGPLALRTWLNGELRQDSSTADLIFDLPTLVSFASHVMTLLPGDVLTTGTPPGVGNLTAGDRVAIEIEGVGRLENPVVDAGE